MPLPSSFPMVTLLSPDVGYLTSVTAKRLADHGTDVRIVTRSPVSLSISPGVRVETPDWRTGELSRSLRASDLLIVSLTWGDALNRVDAACASQISAAVAAAGSGGLVLLSSTEPYGMSQTSIESDTPPIPDEPRGERALAVEDEVRAAAAAANRAVTTLRLPHVYGPGSALFEYVGRGAVPMSGDPATVCSHLHVDDATRAILAACGSESVGEIAIADYEPMSWIETMECLRRADPDVEFRFLPQWAAERALRLLDIDGLGIPSGIAPGTGLGWRRDQSIDPSRGWAALGRRPLYPSFQSGVASSLGRTLAESVAS